MDKNMLFIYINFLLLSDQDFPHQKISNLMWPVFRDAENTKVIKSEFYEFLGKYAANPFDLDVWPIVRFFEIWG